MGADWETAMKQRTIHNRSRRRKPYVLMTADELAEATKEFDRPLPASRFRPMTKADRERWERAKSKLGKGMRSLFLLDVDPALLSRASRFARQKGITLSEVFERGVRGVLAFDA